MKFKEMMAPAPNYDLKDFLTAVGFLAPQGTTLDTFIVPAKSDFQLPENTGFAPLESNLGVVPGVTDTIVYKRREPAEMLDCADWPVEYNDLERQLPGANGPSREYKPTESPVGNMGSPFIGGGKETYAFKNTQTEDNFKSRLRQRTETTRLPSGSWEVRIKEAVGPFVKNSVLHFERV